MIANSIVYRQAEGKDFDLTYNIKSNSIRHLVDKIWGWDDTEQLDYHEKQFNPERIRIIVYENQAIGYISIFETEETFFIENILIETAFQSKGIGTEVLLDSIKTANNKNIELQVLKINESAKRLYEKLNFEVFEQTDLHYRMRYKKINIRIRKQQV